MKYEISPGRDGEPTLYYEHYPIAVVYDVEKVQALLSKLDIAEKAFDRIIRTSQTYTEYDSTHELINEFRLVSRSAIKEIRS